ncbi:MAG TPA: hypothetical protein VIL26_04335 [Clostridia bacterium]
MVLKDIIIDTATMLKLDAVLALPEIGGDAEDEQAQKDLDLIKKCINLTLNEIASDYIPLNYVQDVLVADGKIPYTALNKTALKIKSIKDDKGKDCFFKVYPSYIYTDCEGNCEIEYCYIPAQVEELDQVIENDPKVTSRLIAYGAAREYCLVMSMYEEAQSFDSRYKQTLQNIASQNTVLKIPKRLWR